MSIANTYLRVKADEEKLMPGYKIEPIRRGVDENGEPVFHIIMSRTYVVVGGND
jgi:hypothetical protein